MSSIPEFGPPVDARDLAAGLEIVKRAFGAEQWTRTSWLDGLGEELFCRHSTRPRSPSTAEQATSVLGVFTGSRRAPTGSAW